MARFARSIPWLLCTAVLTLPDRLPAQAAAPAALSPLGVSLRSPAEFRGAHAPRVPGLARSPVIRLTSAETHWCHEEVFGEGAPAIAGRRPVRFAIDLPRYGGMKDGGTAVTEASPPRLCATKRRRIPRATPAVVPAPPPEPQPGPDGGLPLAAWGAIVIDALSGEVLYESNADSPQYPASTTKIMTALLVIEEGDLDHEVECDLDDSKVGESSLELKPGQRFTRRQMLYGLMLKSANDVAHALGRDNAGSIEAFAEKMTRRARELGATNTHFANPNGLHDPDHYTTPRDLACIARAAMHQPFFRQVVGTRDYNWTVNGAINPLHNHNRLLERFPGCTGVKTGYTIPAQQVLVSSATRGDHEVISVVMHTDKPGIWNDSMLLLSYGLDRLSGTVPPNRAAGP